jgi:hypothetical protein
MSLYAYLGLTYEQLATALTTDVLGCLQTEEVFAWLRSQFGSISRSRRLTLKAYHMSQAVLLGAFPDVAEMPVMYTRGSTFR